MTQDFAFIERPITHRALHDIESGVLENSISAFQASIDCNYAIECDLQISADGRAMVFHDPVLSRLTNRTEAVADLTCKELETINLTGGKDTIRPLEEHLALVAGQVPLVLELKSEPSGSVRLVNAVAKALEGYDGSVAVMSFDHAHCQRFREEMPSVPRGLTAMGKGESAITHRQAMKDYDLQFLSYNIKDLPTPFVEEVRKEGKPVITWTVRTADDVGATRAYADQMTFESFRP